MSSCWFLSYHKIPAWSLLLISSRWGRISDIFQLCPQWGSKELMQRSQPIFCKALIFLGVHTIHVYKTHSHALSSFWFSFFFIVYSKQASELREQRNSSIRGNNQLRNVRAFLPSYKCFRCAFNSQPLIPNCVRLMVASETFQTNERPSYPEKNTSWLTEALNITVNSACIFGPALASWGFHGDLLMPIRVRKTTA